MPYSNEHKSRSKTRILLSAGTLFRRYGFDNVSINDIMKLARMTHGAFYAHFSSKQELFRAAVLDSCKNKTVSRLAKGPRSIRQLTGMVADYLNLKILNEQAEPGPASILVNEINNHRPEVKHLYEETYTFMRDLIRKRITALSRLRKLPFADKSSIDDASRAILAILVGALAIARNLSSEEEQQSILRAAQRQILAMLGLAENEFVLV